MPQLLTLTTDFGLDDGYVAAMKGVILGIAPTLRTVDISHGITPHDVMEAAFVLRQAVPFFPPGTVHLAVVDPGVGTARRAVAARIGGQTFVGPDNGLFSLLAEGGPEAVVELDRPAFWRTATPSRTFHGRDVFAPVAARLAAGLHALEEVGRPVEGLQRLQWVQPRADEQGVEGWVVHVDRFGNAITNIPEALLARRAAGRRVRAYVGSAILEGLHLVYADVPEGEPVALIGSGGLLEVGIRGGSASQLLSLQKGMPVQLVFLERD